MKDSDMQSTKDPRSESPLAGRLARRCEIAGTIDSRHICRRYPAEWFARHFSIADRLWSRSLYAGSDEHGGDDLLYASNGRRRREGLPVVSGTVGVFSSPMSSGPGATVGATLAPTSAAVGSAMMKKSDDNQGSITEAVSSTPGAAEYILPPGEQEEGTPAYVLNTQNSGGDTQSLQMTSTGNPSAVTQRLLQRNKTAGVMDAQSIQHHRNQSAGWHAQRLPLISRLISRRDFLDNDGSESISTAYNGMPDDERKARTPVVWGASTPYPGANAEADPPDMLVSTSASVKPSPVGVQKSDEGLHRHASILVDGAAQAISGAHMVLQKKNNDTGVQRSPFASRNSANEDFTVRQNQEPQTSDGSFEQAPRLIQRSPDPDQSKPATHAAVMTDGESSSSSVSTRLLHESGRVSPISKAGKTSSDVFGASKIISVPSGSHAGSGIFRLNRKRSSVVQQGPVADTFVMKKEAVTPASLNARSFSADKILPKKAEAALPEKDGQALIKKAEDSQTYEAEYKQDDTVIKSALSASVALDKKTTPVPSEAFARRASSDAMVLRKNADVVAQNKSRDAKSKNTSDSSLFRLSRKRSNGIKQESVAASPTTKEKTMPLSALTVDRQGFSEAIIFQKDAGGPDHHTGSNTANKDGADQAERVAHTKEAPVPLVQSSLLNSPISSASSTGNGMVLRSRKTPQEHTSKTDDSRSKDGRQLETAPSIKNDLSSPQAAVELDAIGGAPSGPALQRYSPREGAKSPEKSADVLYHQAPAAVELPADPARSQRPDIVWRKSAEHGQGGRGTPVSDRNEKGDLLSRITSQPGGAEVSVDRQTSSDNGVRTGTAVPDQASSSAAPEAIEQRASIDLERITAQVMRIISRQIEVERERRGIGRWF